MNYLKRRKVIVILVTCVVVALVFIGIYESEPRYQGKSVLDWSKVLWAGSPAEQATAVEAIRSIGTNAIPSLERMLRRRKDSKMMLRFMDLCSKQSFVRYPYMDTALGHQRLALKAAAALGEKARPMVPLLQEIIQNWQSYSLDLVYESSRIAKRFEPATTPDLEVWKGKPQLIYHTTNTAK